MIRQHRRRGMSIMRGVTGLAIGALVVGLVSVTQIAVAQSGDDVVAADETEIVPGGVYGWGNQGTLNSPEFWELEFDNSQAPFVDMAVPAGSGDKGLIAVTESGNIVAEGDHEAVTSMPSSLADADVVAVEIGPYDASAAVTAQGEIITWNGAPEAPVMTDAVDVEIGHQYGIAMKGDGTIEVWGHADMVEGAPDLSDVVRVVANQHHAVVVTGDGAVHTWGKNVAQEALLDIPEEVEAATIVDVASGGNAVFALTDDGEVHGWGGAASGNSFPVDHQADGQVIALGDSTRSNRWLAATDRGELIAWGGGGAGAHPLMRTVPEYLQGYEVLAMESGAEQHAVILGEPLDTEPGPVSDPVIEGEPVVGATLTGVHGEFNFEPLLYAESWYVADDADGTNAEVAGPGGEELTVTEAHEGRYLMFRSSAVHPDDPSEPIQVDSEYLGPIEPAPEPGPVSDPVIEGAPVVGATLTGVHGEFNFEPLLYTTSWYVADDADGTNAELAGPPGEQLTLTEVHEGRYITFSSGAVHPETFEVFQIDSEYLGPIVEFAVAEEGDSLIEGEALIGQTLTGVPATFTAEPDEVSYAWLAGGEVIEDETDTTLVLTEEHLGEDITFRTTGEIDGIEPLDSVSEPVVVGWPPFGEDEPSLVSGTAKVGETLEGHPATFTLEPDAVSYAWLVVDGDDLVVIDGETDTTLELTDDHEGAQIVFRTIGVHESAEEPVVSDSDPVGPVAAEDVPVEFTELPSIEGTPEVGQTLTGIPGEFTGDIDGEPVHEWVADGGVIGTGTELELTTEHIGLMIQFRTTVIEVVSGEPVSAVSEPAVGPVVLADDDDGDGSPTPPPGDDDEALRCLIATPDTLEAGIAHEVSVDLSGCGDWAGSEVRVWLFSDPIDLGTATVGVDGTFTVTIPADVPAGAHQLAVYEPDGGVDENGDPVDVLIGYADITLTGDGAGGPGSGGLPATGYDGSLSSLMLAVMLILAGGIALVAARMRKELRA